LASANGSALIFAGMSAVGPGQLAKPFGDDVFDALADLHTLMQRPFIGPPFGGQIAPAQKLSLSA
jgi:hypothetical protein